MKAAAFLAALVAGFASFPAAAVAAPSPVNASYVRLVALATTDLSTEPAETMHECGTTGLSATAGSLSRFTPAQRGILRLWAA